jgi:hypothetical protein
LHGLNGLPKVGEYAQAVQILTDISEDSRN